MKINLVSFIPTRSTVLATFESQFSYHGLMAVPTDPVWGAGGGGGGGAVGCTVETITLGTIIFWYFY